MSESFFGMVMIMMVVMMYGILNGVRNCVEKDISEQSTGSQSLAQEHDSIFRVRCIMWKQKQYDIGRCKAEQENSEKTVARRGLHSRSPVENLEQPTYLD